MIATTQNTGYKPTVIVIGGGPVGVRFVTDFLKKIPFANVLLFGDEKYRPYNRVQLSALLAGDISVDDIALSLPPENDQFSYVTTRIESIEPTLKRVTDKSGQHYNFDSLVLATGATPHVPNISDIDQTGVYTFRNLKDAESLSTRTFKSKHIVVVGGGVLGIETAHALHRNNTNITLVQQGSHLMNRQLDETAATIVQQDIEEKGIRVITNTGVRTVSGDGRVTGVVLRNRELIECDTVVFCSGITPSIDIARSARVKVNYGIVVDEQLRTSHPSIYAIGECAEFEGSTYGLVSPGYEQAAVLADVLSGGEAVYRGSSLSSKLKIDTLSVQSIGQPVGFVRSPLTREVTYNRENCYRKIVVNRDKFIGAVSVGDWPESLRVQEVHQQQRKLNFVQLMLFKFTGRLWLFSEASNVQQWDANAIVCQCNGISRGQLSLAKKQGCVTVESLSDSTGAGSVCGSCKPLLQQLIGSSQPREREWAWPALIISSLLAFAAAGVMALTPGLQVTDTVQHTPWFERLWNDKYWKQVTGFSLLGLTAIGLFMSLRKRIKSERLGKFAYWRFLHIALGVVSAGVLMAHTGLHTGDNLNQALVINFLLVLILGAMATSVVALSHQFEPANAQRIRKFWSWFHIVVTWPLPVLLGMHILTVYYF